ncbi:hypothetical protein HHI36_016817 [Cryptolaemus montrouzieri]|uniref:Uncharacterized protein n=1 Tax=Cryptolaemus montrouzieri TaxID=559131 RepID=A0ABD2NL30_9CUCU
MKADIPHGLKGRKWNKTKEVLDFESLEQLIKSFRKITRKLGAEDFLEFGNACQSRKKCFDRIPLLNELKVVEFRTMSRSMFYEKDITEDSLSERKFLKSKFKLDLPGTRISSSGVNTEKNTEDNERFSSAHARKKSVILSIYQQVKMKISPAQRLSTIEDVGNRVIQLSANNSETISDSGNTRKMF